MMFLPRDSDLQEVTKPMKPIVFGFSIFDPENQDLP